MEINLAKQDVPEITIIQPDGQTREVIRLPGIALAAFLQKIPKVFGLRGLREVVAAVKEKADMQRDPVLMCEAVDVVLAKVKPDLAGNLDIETFRTLFDWLCSEAFGSRAASVQGEPEKKA